MNFDEKEFEIGTIMVSHLMEISSEMSTKSACSHIDKSHCFGVSVKAMDNLNSSNISTQDLVAEMGKYFKENSLLVLRKDGSLSSIITNSGGFNAKHSNQEPDYHLFAN